MTAEVTGEYPLSAIAPLPPRNVNEDAPSYDEQHFSSPPGGAVGLRESTHLSTTIRFTFQ